MQIYCIWYYRIDFEEFTIAGPVLVNTEEGICTDTLDITSPDTTFSIPQICGENTGQHCKCNSIYNVIHTRIFKWGYVLHSYLHISILVFVPMGDRSSDTATISLKFTDQSSSKKWNMKIAQIECGSQLV